MSSHVIIMSKEHNASSVIQKILNILLLFDDDILSLSVEDISTQLDIPVSTVYRHVRVLCENGFLEKSQDNQYSLGMTFLKLGRLAFNSNRNLRLLILPSMRRIAEDIGESVSLMRLFHNEVICIENIEGKHALRVTIEPGRVHQIHAGASAKAILAHLPEEQWQERLNFPLPKFTHTTFFDSELLFEELYKIRQQGYSVSNGEIDVGARAVAVPLLNRQKHVVAALSIEAPESRMSDEKMYIYRDMLKQEADAIQQHLH